MAYVNEDLPLPPAALKRIEDLEKLVQELTADRDAWEGETYRREGEAYDQQRRTHRTKLGWHEWSDWWEQTARSLGYVDDPPGKGKKGDKGKGKGGKGGRGKGKGTKHGKGTGGEQVTSDAMDVAVEIPKECGKDLD